MKPWQVWEKRDGTLTVPRDATREDLYRLADKILEYAARAPVCPLTIKHEKERSSG
jgi:hypothetical protein